MDKQHIKDITQTFLHDYEKAKRENLLNQPEWKIDSLITEFENSFNESDLNLNEKVDYLVNKDANPFIVCVKELISKLINANLNEVLNLIDLMTNGKFLDSIGIPTHSNKYETSRLIEQFVNELENIKTAS